MRPYYQVWLSFYYFAWLCRLWAHRAEDAVGEGGHHLLRHPGDPPDAALPLQHRRHHGAELPFPVLESVLLRLHQEAEERLQQERQEHQEHSQAVGVSSTHSCLYRISYAECTYSTGSIPCSRGRYSGRSRTSSFRRSGRTSQRSADSALGLSECRSSYSDTDCRYIDDADLMMGRDIQANRASQHSRFSDTMLQVSSAITPPIEQGI